jgi:hypothetical protein
MANSTLLYSIGSFVAGAILSSVISAGFNSVAGNAQTSDNRTSVVVESEQPEQKDAVAGRMNTNRVSPFQATLSEVEGVQQMVSDDEKLDEFVVVPSSLIASFSNSSKSQILRGGLFANASAIQEALKISDNEKAQMQRNWRAVLKQMKRVEREGAKVEELENGLVQINVPAMEEPYEKLGESFQEGLVNVLGENRATAFSAAQHLQDVFSPKGELSYVVKMEATGDGFWRYHITQSGADGGATWVGSKVPRHLRHLTEKAKIVSELEIPKSESEDE